jgi:hypothetical protein
VAGFLPRRPGYDSNSDHLGFLENAVTYFLRVFRFLCQFSFHQIPHTRPSSETGTVSQLVAELTNVTAPKGKKTYMGHSPSMAANISSNSYVMSLSVKQKFNYRVLECNFQSPQWS